VLGIFLKISMKKSLKSGKPFWMRILIHQMKLSNLEYSSSEEREIRTFQKQIQTLKLFMKAKGIE